MSKHTPGPWQVHGSHVYSADPDRALIAQVFNPGSKISDYPLVQNARLIAAAPELLKALKAMLLEFNEQMPVVFVHDELAAIASARAAIAKATGEA